MRISQTRLPFKVEADTSGRDVTSFAGLPLIIEAARSLGICDDIAGGLGIRKRDRGYDERELSETILALIAGGGNHLSNVDTLKEDPGYASLLGMKSLPDERTLGRFLRAFHDPLKVGKLEQGQSVIPEESKPLARLGDVVRNLTLRTAERSPCSHATLDWDTQRISTSKEEALLMYKGGTGYQPAAIRWAEMGLIVADEFRPGNIRSGDRVLPLVERTIQRLPPGVTKISFRGDSAAYEWKFLDYLAHRPGGAVEFAITADWCEKLEEKAAAIPEETWKMIYQMTEYGLLPTDDAWAEVEYVSQEAAKRFPVPLRFILVRHGGQLRLPGLEHGGPSQRFHAVVTNLPHSVRGDEVVRWHRGRCGSIERVFRVLCNDQAAATFPCGQFGANAAWYRFNVLLYNLIQVMRLTVMPEPLKTKELKGIRFGLLRLAGRIVHKARTLILKIDPRQRALEWIQAIRAGLARLAAKSSLIPFLASA